MPDDAAPQAWHDLYWRAWDALRFDRAYGVMGGQAPIPYLVLSQYARDHCIDGDDFRIFRRLMNAIDDEWLAYVAERDKDS